MGPHFVVPKNIYKIFDVNFGIELPYTTLRMKKLWSTDETLYSFNWRTFNHFPKIQNFKIFEYFSKNKNNFLGID